MTPQQRRVILATCVSVGLAFLVGAGPAFLIEPMSEDLGISDAAVEVVLSVPSIASLTVIVIAGLARGLRFDGVLAFTLVGVAWLALMVAGRTSLLRSAGSRQAAATAAKESR